MEAYYNVWRDAFDTYQSFSDWIKALWLIVPPGFILVPAALLRRGELEHRAPAFMTAAIHGATPDKAEIRHWQALSDNSGLENRLSIPDTSGDPIADRGGNRGGL